MQDDPTEQSPSALQATGAAPASAAVDASAAPSGEARTSGEATSEVTSLPEEPSAGAPSTANGLSTLLASGPSRDGWLSTGVPVASPPSVVDVDVASSPEPASADARVTHDATPAETLQI
jgi:hypothetical protein